MLIQNLGKISSQTPSQILERQLTKKQKQAVFNAMPNSYQQEKAQSAAALKPLNPSPSDYINMRDIH